MAQAKGSSLADWYLSAFPAVRPELGLPFGGFGPRGGPARAARAAQAARWLEETKDGPGMRLARRALRQAQDSEAAGLAEAVLACLVQAELQGAGRDAVCRAVVSALAGEVAAGEDPRALDQAARAAALAAGLLLAVGAEPERAAEGEPGAEAFMALEGFVRAVDAARGAAAARPAIGPHAVYDLLRAETGLAVAPKELAEAAMVRLEAELVEVGRLAREIAPGADLATILGDLAEDRPESPQELMAAYEAAQAEVLAAVGEDFPDVRPPSLAPGPAQLHGLLPLAAYQPGPFAGGRGRMLVFAGQGPMQAMHMRARLPLTTAQVGVPGSHLLFSLLPAGDLLGRLEVSPYVASAWSGYAAAYVAARLDRPKVRLLAALDAASAAARAFADVALHAELAGEERILAVLGRPQGLPDEFGRAELRALWRLPLAAAGPFALAEAFGDEVRQRAAGGESPRAAHQAILDRGGMPEEVAG